MAKIMAAPNLPEDLQQERDFLLNLLTRPLEPGSMLTVNWDNAGPENQTFLEHYQQFIFPLEQQLQHNNNLINIYQLLLDRALFLSEDERTKWKQQILHLRNQSANLLSAPQYQEAIKTSGILAANLTGDLAAKSRQSLTELELSTDSPVTAVLAQRISALYQEITENMKSQSLAEGLSTNFQATNQLINDFHQGKLDFPTAAAEMDRLALSGPVAYSNQVATNLQNELNELAILRTRWAQAKGFPTWGAYIQRKNQRNYTSGLQSARAKMQLLEKLLGQMRRPTQELFTFFAAKMPGPVNRSQVELVLPPDRPLIAPYFPQTKLIHIWQSAMEQLGFNQALLNKRQLDLTPRTNKFTNAYMVNLQAKTLQHLTIDATSLNLVDRQNWRYPGPIIRVVANFLGDGIIPLQTLMHEGGHLLDFFHHLPGILSYYSNAFAETHSKFMELFLEEKEFLMAYGETAAGVKITPDLVQTYLQNRAINQLFFWQEAMMKALYDLQIWDYAYGPTGPQFVDRCYQVAKNLEQQYGVLPTNFPHQVNYYGANFRTTHFISGQISYYGYIFADIAAFLSFQHLKQLRRNETGAKALFGWHRLAQLLIDGYYQFGNDLPFPENIEKFVGAQFRPEKYVADLVGKIKHLSKSHSCQKYARNLL